MENAFGCIILFYFSFKFVLLFSPECKKRCSKLIRPNNRLTDMKHLQRLCPHEECKSCRCVNLQVDDNILKFPNTLQTYWWEKIYHVIYVPVAKIYSVAICRSILLAYCVWTPFDNFVGVSLKELHQKGDVCYLEQNTVKHAMSVGSHYHWQNPLEKWRI